MQTTSTTYSAIIMAVKLFGVECSRNNIMLNKFWGCLNTQWPCFHDSKVCPHSH